MIRSSSNQSLFTWALGAAWGVMAAVAHAAPQEVVVGIGTQNTTTNTVTGGIVLDKLGLLEKHLPKTGKYANIKFVIDWQNFTSGPPVTNGMMAGKLQIGMMGDYPLLVNGATFQAGNDTKSKLIAILAYNQFGAGNGVVVHKDSPYYQLSDLKGKRISAPFGSAAHGMLLKAMEDRGWKDDFWDLSSQSPEVGTTNLQEKKLDAHADFVPFMELLPFKGFARKIFDGVETKLPTFHGVVVREDFAKQYPEFVVGYLKAVMEANDWVRKNPKLAAEKIAEWTKIDKEVVYMFLGPAGIHTLDPSIKPKWVETIRYDTGVLQRLGRVKQFDVNAWVDDSYVRAAFKERGEDYEAQKASFAGSEISGQDTFCKKPIAKSIEAGEVWLKSGELMAYSSAACTLGAIKQFTGQGKALAAAYLFDQNLNIKLFADKAFFAVNDQDPKALVIEPFLLKKDAEQMAAKVKGKVLVYEQVLALIK
ncbi:MAG: ABC transporter substrate-binding protein [Aquabacterium sp.]|uniref:ABC transporter substrate-binding protein n=1 Tax=Aquabacterium sp. TaxID=1872578 RepID=UPI002715B360|nr:ABC transporter substrate-binding protein [Aquabacterium sp.]MDO9002470.1 ABC transporter substrate-binding protein [Aquabacterium sp.]